MNSHHPSGSVIHLERPWAPFSWWLIGAVAALSLIAVTGAWTSPSIGMMVTVIVVAAVVEAGRVRSGVTGDVTASDSAAASFVPGSKDASNDTRDEEGSRG